MIQSHTTALTNSKAGFFSFFFYLHTAHFFSLGIPHHFATSRATAMILNVFCPFFFYTLHNTAEFFFHLGFNISFFFPRQNHKI